MSDDQPTARQALVDTLTPLCPRGWQWVTDERARPDDPVTRVQALQRRIIPGRFGATAAHRIGFTVTVTVPTSEKGLSKAEDQLDDDILTFLYALSAAHIQWTTANKAIYDERLGYQLELEIDSLKTGQE